MASLRSCCLIMFILTLMSGCISKKYTKKGALIGAKLATKIHQNSKYKDSKVAGIIIAAGTIYMGAEIGKLFDRLDTIKYLILLEKKRRGEWVRWRNVRTGYRYHMKILSPLYKRNGFPCRDVLIEVFGSGKRKLVYNTACRIAHKQWRVVSNTQPRYQTPHREHEYDNPDREQDYNSSPQYHQPTQDTPERDDPPVTDTDTGTAYVN